MATEIKFENAQEMKRKYPVTFYAPDSDELEKIEAGDFVKVCAFQERFWAEVTFVAEGMITARVDNELLTPHLRYNQLISFKPEHVYNIVSKSERQKQSKAHKNTGHSRRP